MGVFDYFVCASRLPVDGHVGIRFQTKDTPAQSLDTYFCDAFGQLWHEAYDVEDQSDPNAEGWMRLQGMRTRINHRYERCDLTGVIEFYTFANSNPPRGWVEFAAQFLNGQLQSLSLLEHRTHELKENPMSNDEVAIETKIQEKGLTAPRVTANMLEEEIVSEQYHVFEGSCLTVCCLTLRNGFTVTGQSACASPANFDEDIGRQIARRNARDELWPLLGFRLRDQLAG